MKLKLFALIIFVVSFSLDGLQAQNGSKKGKGGDRIQAQLVAYLTNELALTSQEAEKFWPLYNEYKNKERTIKRDMMPNKSLNLMTESEASAYINASMQAEEKELDLRKNYMVEFRKILPATKLAKLPQAERGFKKELIKKLSR